MICLQGGGEFAEPCRAMDGDLVRRAGGGPVVVLPVAAASGREYQAAGANGARHYRSVGGGAVEVAPDPAQDPAAAVAAVGRARLLVLPGGSPGRIRRALVGTDLGAAVTAGHAGGAVVIGASAGAMVLCEHMVMPDGPRTEVVTGLGLVPAAMVLPHWRGDDRWADLVPPGSSCSGCRSARGAHRRRRGRRDGRRSVRAPPGRPLGAARTRPPLTVPPGLF